MFREVELKLLAFIALTLDGDVIYFIIGRFIAFVRYTGDWMSPIVRVH
jgi:hypothetical protein